MKHGLKITSFLVATFITSVFCAVPIVTAIDARTFNPGNIIDDVNFTNTNTMTVGQIQSFLESKMPNCDINGVEKAGGGSSSLTNRQWIERRYGLAPPYRCLRDYRENPETSENNYGRIQTPAGALSAAELIHMYSLRFGINPQVLIVTLQKENGMITDNIPVPRQYQQAMGFGCPDHVAPGQPACDPKYNSLSNQLYQAARHFRGYMERQQGWYVPYVVGNNTILYNPNASCGSSNVFIQNGATAALYSYTPYQPNQSALNAQYGLGDACGAYGNRNFYLYFNDWFGSTQSPPSRTWSMLDQGQVISGSNNRTNTITMTPGSTTTLYIKAKNTGNQVWYNGNTTLATSRPENRPSAYASTSWPGTNRPAQLLEPRVKPGETGTFMFSITAPNNFTKSREYFNIVHEGIAWENDIGLYFDISVTAPKDNSYNARIISNKLYHDPALTKPLGFADGRVRAGQTIYGELIFQNTGGATMTNSVVKLGTFSPVDRVSAFRSDLWPSATRVAHLIEQSVKPTETGHIRFSLTAPTPGWYNETFALVAEGITWIPSTSMSYRMEVTPNYSSNMTSGQAIATGTQIMSKNLKYRLIIQPDGNMVLYSNSTPIWHTHTAGAAGPTLVMQSDGNLVLYATGTKPVWNSQTVTGQHSMLQLQEDGNLVMYASGNIPRWSTNTSGR